MITRMVSSGRFLLVLAWAVAVVVAHSEESVRYDGYRLLRIIPQTKQHISALRTLISDNELDFWLEPTAPGSPVDILVSPRKLGYFQRYLNDMGLQMESLIDDVQSLIGEQEQVEKLGNDNTTFDWKDYHTIESINSWLKEQAQEYSKIATIISASKSTEGRELLGLRIAHKPDQPIVFIEAGIHAREWITPASATWFIQQALNETASDLIKSYEWHVFPSVNPDGYAFTQKNRMWRKTRSKLNSNCYGVDANRNWPYQWKTEWSECSETYPGKKPASEPETKGLMSYLKTVADRTLVYISLHSYSQLLMYPWGYTNELPPNAKRFADIASKAAAKLKARYGTAYKYGPISTTIYPAFGTTIDYAYSINITYPFVFELRDTGKYGFLLPKEEIIPTAEETFDALNVILEEAKK